MNYNNVAECNKSVNFQPKFGSLMLDIFMYYILDFHSNPITLIYAYVTRILEYYHPWVIQYTSHHQTAYLLHKGPSTINIHVRAAKTAVFLKWKNVLQKAKYFLFNTSYFYS
jgi:hypothetical protein